MRSLLDLENGRHDVSENPRSRQKLDPLGCLDGALEGPVDGEPADVDLRADVRGVPDGQLGSRPDLPLEPPIDSERVLEGKAPRM